MILSIPKITELNVIIALAMHATYQVYCSYYIQLSSFLTYWKTSNYCDVDDKDELLAKRDLLLKERETDNASCTISRSPANKNVRKSLFPEEPKQSSTFPIARKTSKRNTDDLLAQVSNKVIKL